MSIKKAIQEQAESEEINPIEYENLLLDGLVVDEISLEDKEFL
jgi:hypothetical protein